ncbi:hypothetical protein E2C01_034473 [Portunus trituberculatus]|uniref:Uncharacterized protein n=1 Tax=Portunus trituberculatus TaxID=210409 RepID=A0A5B7F6S5_PORTR|nr:hypothetical protein [Portunus trituberculatus]
MSPRRVAITSVWTRHKCVGEATPPGPGAALLTGPHSRQDTWAVSACCWRCYHRVVPLHNAPHDSKTNTGEAHSVLPRDVRVTAHRDVTTTSLHHFPNTNTALTFQTSGHGASSRGGAWWATHTFSPAIRPLARRSSLTSRGHVTDTTSFLSNHLFPAPHTAHPTSSTSTTHLHHTSPTCTT